MAKLEEPLPVKLFCAILYKEFDALKIAQRHLIEKFSPIDYQSEEFPFSVTDYYEEELGKDLLRVFFSFENLIPPQSLPEIKIACMEIEELLSKENKRMVNIDPGYLDFYKVVLSSAKPGWQKVYLHRGIYADPALFYSKGEYYPFEWSFPDFKSGIYNKFFLEIRQIYKKQLKNL